MSSLIHSSKPVARKPHNCDCCARTISPGEQYCRDRLVGDDGPYVIKTCGQCVAFIDLYIDEFCYDRHEGWYPEDIREWEPDDDLGREYKRRWTNRWHDGYALYPVPTRAPSGDKTAIELLELANGT